MKDAIPIVNLADSSLISFELIKGDLIVNICSWQEETVTLKFSNAIGMKYELADFIQGIYEFEDRTFIETLILKSHANLEDLNKFKLYRIIDIYDFPILEIVAENLNVMTI